MAAQQETYDVCVIGSGPAGGVLSKELAEAGAKVVLIEAGHTAKFQDFHFHSMPYEQANVREIRVEYFDSRCAENAVRSLNETQLGVSTSALAREHIVDIFI